MGNINILAIKKLNPKTKKLKKWLQLDVFIKAKNINLILMKICCF